MTSLDITNGVRTALTRLREAWEWYDAIPPVRKIHSALGQVADGWRRISRWINSVHAEGALCPRAADHHRADGDPAVGGRLRVHGAALERGDAAAVRQRRAGHRGADRHLSRLSAGRRPGADPAHRAGAARAGRSISCRWPKCRRPGPKPFFSLLDQALSDELRKQIGRPFWIDTVGSSALVEIRIQLDNTVMRVFARRSAAYASNSEIFLLWMVGTSLVLLTVAIMFLRNQIKPILRLADAAESFGKGREVPNFRPRGAREVRRAAAAFIEMKTRIERAIEQRTAMLAGVSHDLRTVLTRFKLELALIGDCAGSRRDEEGRRRDGPHARGLSRLRARRQRRARRRRPTWPNSSTS